MIISAQKILKTVTLALLFVQSASALDKLTNSQKLECVLALSRSVAIAHHHAAHNKSAWAPSLKITTDVVRLAHELIALYNHTNASAQYYIPWSLTDCALLINDIVALRKGNEQTPTNDEAPSINPDFNSDETLDKLARLLCYDILPTIEVAATTYAACASNDAIKTRQRTLAYSLGSLARLGATTLEHSHEKYARFILAALVLQSLETIYQTGKAFIDDENTGNKREKFQSTTTTTIQTQNEQLQQKPITTTKQTQDKQTQQKKIRHNHLFKKNLGIEIPDITKMVALFTKPQLQQNLEPDQDFNFSTS